MTVSGSGTAPPERAKTRNGTTSGVRVREDVEDELADVLEDAPPGGDRRDDRREVVVGEHHRRRLPRDVGARLPHRHADVGRRSAGASFTPSPVIATT